MKRNDIYKDNDGNEIALAILLPCPFCGSMPELTFIGNSHTRVQKVRVKCTNGSCRIERTDAARGFDHEWLARKAVERWNERYEVLKEELEGEKKGRDEEVADLRAKIEELETDNATLSQYVKTVSVYLRN